MDDGQPVTGSAATPSVLVPRPATAENADHASPARRRWGLFLALALAVVVVDQVAKTVVTARLAPGQSVDVIGDLVRVVFGQNSGALFGLFKANAAMFGVVSLIVVGLIVTYHARSAASLYATVTLGLLLGGAIGNMVDRLRLGFVVDFVDVGVGSTRFYTFNIADSAISLAILLLFVAALQPSLIDGRSASPATATPGHAADDDFDVDDAGPAAASHDDAGGHN